MATVSSNILRRMITVADPSVPRQELLDIAGVTSVEPETGQPSLVSDDAYYTLIERAVRDGDHQFPLRYGASVEPAMFGALGHAMVTAPTLQDAIERIIRYILVVSDTLEYDLHITEDGAAIRLLGRTGPRHGMQVANECALAAMTTILRSSVGAPLRASLVTFRHAAPPTTRDHRAYFGGPVRFGATEDALHLPASALSARTRLADAGLSAYLLAQLDDLHREQGGDRSVVERVRAAVADTLCDGVPGKAEVASRLAMSERTLHRRLADHDATFQQVTDEVRLDIACSLLADPGRPLGEVAFFTGFAGQSAFTRAFKRWTGTTPLAHRQQLTGS
ncbi:AraC family transcriptional regulator [Salsipaludibacter albus]|uniref:AraC family transcriptional regulator n=1 Tax=Salsipaludibacter albus TaxID=2849650 RepID=UPI001EE406D5|nr:AraC family transcriptional regulator [Salsipaludibacter albus]MBY5163643.1 AraC family transcriptional regulator [Salsipaludibacter albus]